MIRFGLGFLCLIIATGILEDPFLPGYAVGLRPEERSRDFINFIWLGCTGFALIVWAIIDLTTDPNNR